MKATVHLSILCVGLALAGCKAANTSTGEDAAPPATDVANQDAAAIAPDLAASAPDLAAPAPDLAASAPDLAAPAPDLAAPAPDLAAPAPDLAAPAPDVAVIADVARDTTSSSPDMATFCGGASKMVVNGISSTPTVTGKVVPYDCCDGAELDIVSTAFEHPIVVSWQAQAGAFKMFSTIDLAKPATGWTVEVLVGCTSTLGCTTPVDSYTSGLTGSLSVEIGKSAPYDMSLCLHAEESASAPHSVVHSLDLFITHVSAK